ncbi:MAG: hypothetical protein LC798_08335 [Chloroflexi bacterium]|nr:hypothetical protein [Chloroflexota bacterium]
MPRSYDPRRAKAGHTYQFVDAGGQVHRITADDEGVIRPANDAEAAFADRRGLSVAQKVKAEQADKKEA